MLPILGLTEGRVSNENGAKCGGKIQSNCEGYCSMSMSEREREMERERERERDLHTYIHTYTGTVVCMALNLHRSS